MAMSMHIQFDRPNGVYCAGETVKGQVVVKVTKMKRLGAFGIHFLGEANVKWKEQQAKSDHTETYKAHETYLDNWVYFLGGNGRGPSQMVVYPGQHVYSFQYSLPRLLPCSFEGDHGSVRYTATATMFRPWKFDHSVKAAFTVIADLDLNNCPAAKKPVSVTASKTFWCWCCTSGPVSLDVDLASGGYVPGQTIQGQICVDNASDVCVEDVTCSLVKEVTWRSPSKHKVTQRVETEVRIGNAANEGDCQVLKLALTVPALPPSNLNHCGIIDIKYILRVTAEISGMHFDLHCNVPILIGTIPVFVAHDGNRARMAVPGAPLQSDLPPPYSAKMPRLTYEESNFHCNIVDATDKYTMGQADFTPRYPVWAFNDQGPCDTQAGQDGVKAGQAHAAL